MTGWSDLERRTPAEIRARHAAFRASIAGKAVVDRGIACLSASVRVAALPDRPKRQDRWAPLIAEVLAAPPPQEHPILTIQKAVARHYDVDMREAMTSKCRIGPLILPRWVAIWLAREMTGKSLAEIGRRFGRRDHSTIHFAIAEVAGKIATDPAFAAEVSALRAEIEAKT